VLIAFWDWEYIIDEALSIIPSAELDLVLN
jgi:hypothetical protein